MKTRIAHLGILPILVAGALMASVYLEAYVDSGRRWSSTAVLYYVNPQSVYLSRDLAINAVRTAAAAWNEANASIELVYAGTTGGSSLTMNNKNEVFFRNGSNGSYAAETYSWWDSKNLYKDSDIVFYEGAFPYFSVSGCSKGVYAESIATHEFGHMLGLRHTNMPGATMQASMPTYCDRSWMTLEEDDISGIQAMYPGTSSTPPPPPPPSDPPPADPPPGEPSDPPPANTAPTVAIANPVNGSSYAEGAGIKFSGSARDNEDGDLTARLVWVSNLSGQIGTGGSFSKVLSAGTHTISARVSDNGALSGSQQITVTVTKSVAPPPPSGGQLSVNAYKVKGQQKADLTWSGVAGTKVDVYRNGTKIGSPSNTGSMTDHINAKGGGAYRYKVCSSGTTTCSNEVAVSF